GWVPVLSGNPAAVGAESDPRPPDRVDARRPELAAGPRVANHHLAVTIIPFECQAHRSEEVTVLAERHAGDPTAMAPQDWGPPRALALQVSPFPAPKRRGTFVEQFLGPPHVAGLQLPRGQRDQVEVATRLDVVPCLGDCHRPVVGLLPQNLLLRRHGAE